MELLARTCQMEQMNAQRIGARFMVIVGGLFWLAAKAGAVYAYQGAPFTEVVGNAVLYAAGIAVIFVIGMFYEYLAAAILVAGAIGVIVWGIVAGWETGVWSTMAVFFVAPMVIAAVLFAMAARMQRICAL